MFTHGFADNPDHCFNCASVFCPFLHLRDWDWTPTLSDGDVTSPVQGRSNSIAPQPCPWQHPLQHTFFPAFAGPSGWHPEEVGPEGSVSARKPGVRIGPSGGKSSERCGDFLLLSVRLQEEEWDRSGSGAELSASRTVSDQQTMVFDQWYQW